MSAPLPNRRHVILESPYSGDVDANVAYARACIRDCIKRGEAPLASHLLYTQPGILNDDDPSERLDGIECGWSWYVFADACVVYTDRGISEGMAQGIDIAKRRKVAVEYRRLGT